MRSYGKILAFALALCAGVGAYAESDLDAYLRGKVFRMWWNEDVAFNGNVGGVEGRENLFPVGLQIRQFVEAWGGKGVTFTLKGDGSVYGTFTTLGLLEAGGVYRSSEVLAGESLAEHLEDARLVRFTPQGYVIPDNVLERIRTVGDLVIACEMRPGGSRSFMVFEAKAGDATLFSFPMSFSGSSVTNMYRWVNLRHLSGEAETDATDVGLPSNADWDDRFTNVFFIHGANVNESQSRVWCERIFKRLWMSGAKMKFHGISWRSKVQNDWDYHLNVSNAFEVASAVANVVSNVPGRKVVIAHSLGTMVASSAIKDHGLQVDKLILLNSAIPSEAFYGNLFDANPTNRLVHGEWVDYPSACWTARWNELFDEADARSKLTWKNRFLGVGAVAVNFFSSGDEVFEIFGESQNPSWYNGVSPSGHWGDRYSWQKQELWKGRRGFMSHLGTTRWSGWGFKSSVLGLRSWSASAATAVADFGVFKTNTVFAAYPESITNSIATRIQQDYHLAQGIPALSRSTGATHFADTVVRSIDMNDEALRINSWPTEPDDEGEGLNGRFLHSDIKDVPYFYTYMIFRRIVEEGGLR